MATRRMTPQEEKRLRQQALEEQQRLAQELWDHRDDPDEWEDEPADVLVAANPGVVYSIRFTAAEFHQVSELATSKGMTIDDLIKTTFVAPDKPEKPTEAKPKRSRRKVRA